MNEITKRIVMGIVFIISLILVFVGQRHIGYMGLGTQVIGLVGLVGLLYIYNRQYK